MKKFGVTVAGVTLVASYIAAYALSAFVTMLLLGALHTSEGMSYVPALGFFQTLGSLYVIGSVGRAFRGVAAITTSTKG